MSDDEATSLADILAALDETEAALAGVLARLRDPLSDAADPGGWTVRQALSHVVGALWRTPVHAGFAIEGNCAIPVQMHDPYWLPEWEMAPVRAFALAALSACAGGRAFLATLTAGDLALPVTTPIGEMPLADFLAVSYGLHIQRFHLPQLEAFVAAQR